jgi:hypothetical protein
MIDLIANRKTPVSWSGDGLERRRESNPHDQLGRRVTNSGRPLQFADRYRSNRISSMIWPIIASDMPSAVPPQAPGVIAPWLA